MARPQFMYHDVRPVNAVVATAQAVASGDLLALTANTVTRAQDETWVSDEATTRANFVAKFLGVSMQDKAADVARPYGNSEDNMIGVSTGGVWEFDCVSATYNQGQRVGPAKQTGNALESQKVVAVNNDGEAIGRVERTTSASATRVRVWITSGQLPLAKQS